MLTRQGSQSPSEPRPDDVGIRHLLTQRSALVAIGGWVAANLWVLVTTDTSLPFDWPMLGDRTPTSHLIDVNVAMLEALLLIAVTVGLTRGRDLPDLATRAPESPVARTETLLLLGYGSAGLGVGFLLARSFGWHPFGLHLAGTLFGTHDDVAPAEAIAWATYNLIVYAVIPLSVFRRRYSAESLNLRSSDRRKDLQLILIVLATETFFQSVALRPQILDLAPSRLLLGVPLSLTLYLAGAVLPAMVFIYAILVPRFLRLTGSVATTVILGGLAYAALHIWDAWTAFTSPSTGTLSAIFLLFTYFGPGMVKTVLTIRTGNAWVHVWAYHAFAPHVLHESARMVNVFRIP